MEQQVVNIYQLLGEKEIQIAILRKQIEEAYDEVERLKKQIEDQLREPSNA